MITELHGKDRFFIRHSQFYVLDEEGGRTFVTEETALSMDATLQRLPLMLIGTDCKFAPAK
jgi:hypothetical protein